MIGAGLAHAQAGDDRIWAVLPGKVALPKSNLCPRGRRYFISIHPVPAAWASARMRAFKRRSRALSWSVGGVWSWTTTRVRSGGLTGSQRTGGCSGASATRTTSLAGSRSVRVSFALGGATLGASATAALGQEAGPAGSGSAGGAAGFGLAAGWEGLGFSARWVTGRGCEAAATAGGRAGLRPCDGAGPPAETTGPDARPGATVGWVSDTAGGKAATADVARSGSRSAAGWAISVGGAATAAGRRRATTRTRRALNLRAWAKRARLVRNAFAGCAAETCGAGGVSASCDLWPEEAVSLCGPDAGGMLAA